MMQRMETYLTYQTTNAFRWWFAYRWRYPELQLVISDFANILIDFYPKEAMDFTATVQVRGNPNILHQLAYNFEDIGFSIGNPN